MTTQPDDRIVMFKASGIDTTTVNFKDKSDLDLSSCNVDSTSRYHNTTLPKIKPATTFNFHP